MAQQANPARTQSPRTRAARTRVQQDMDPRSDPGLFGSVGSGKLDGRVALIAGGDSGIGQAVAVLFAREGADIAIVHLEEAELEEAELDEPALLLPEGEEEEEDIQRTARLVQNEGRRCLLLAGDIGEEAFCREAVAAVIREFGRLDVLVNNAVEQQGAEDLAEITAGRLERTFRTNVFGMFHLTKAALPYLCAGASVVNSASSTDCQGTLASVDCSATKGAVIAFTRALSQSLARRGIRVNAVAPGPVWTSSIPATFSAEQVARFGSDTSMRRAGQPEEVAPSYVFLASPDDSSRVNGQVLRPDGGQVVSV